MKFGILVNEGPYNHEAADSAYQFVTAALDKGHEVPRIFFYYDGVHNGNKLSEPQADDRNIVKRWSELAEERGVDLVVCVAASRTTSWPPASASRVSGSSSRPAWNATGRSLSATDDAEGRRRWLTKWKKAPPSRSS